MGPSTILLSKKFCFTDLHYDSYYNLYFCAVGSRKWTLAPPEASHWLQAAPGRYCNRSDIVPHLGIFKGNPWMGDFPFIEIELDPGDVLFVPSFWWHLVQNIPSRETDVTIAFNFLFSPPANHLFHELEAAQRGVESRIKKRQQLLVTTRKSRKRDNIYEQNQCELLSKRPRDRKLVGQGAATLKPYTRWSRDEERYMLA